MCVVAATSSLHSSLSKAHVRDRRGIHARKHTCAAQSLRGKSSREVARNRRRSWTAYDAQGTISIYTERAPCRSCSSVIRQFEARFPGVKVNITSGTPE
jgi:hypothetical protein